MSDLEGKTVEILNKLDALTTQYAPDVVDKAVHAVAVTGIGNLVNALVGFLALYCTWLATKKITVFFVKQKEKGGYMSDWEIGYSLSYIDGKCVVKCDSIIKWGVWFENADRSVSRTEKNGVRVSTVFLGIDHAFGNSLPILFETMIFGGEYNEEQWRYTTWDAAEKGHVAACKIAGLL